MVSTTTMRVMTRGAFSFTWASPPMIRTTSLAMNPKASKKSRPKKRYVEGWRSR